MTTQIMPSNPKNSIKTRFTSKFLGALKKMNKNRSPASQTMKETYKRYQMIRVASYASMASLAGPKWAWSRAVISKIRKGSLRRSALKKKKTRVHGLRRREVRGNPINGINIHHQEDDLRNLVPGGESMDFCRLLSETAHYMKCLRTQVQIMKNIVDLYSN